MPKASLRKALAAPLMLRIIETTATRREVSVASLLSNRRGSTATATARVLAMAICCAAGVPAHTVARVFGRTWATVDSARSRTVSLCRDSTEACDEFIAILCTCIKS